MLLYLQMSSVKVVLGNNATSAENQQETRHRAGLLRDYTSNIANENLVALIAFLFTDGGIARHGVNSWRIFFANSSLPAVEMFRKLLADSFVIPLARIKVRPRQGHHYFVTLTSKEVGTYLSGRFGTFRTLKFADGSFTEASIPVAWLERINAIPLFLKVAFSMDGGVKFYPMNDKNKGTRWLERRIALACHHPELRKQYCDLLLKAGIQAVNKEKEKVITISRRENIERFARTIGFLDGVAVTRHSKFWIGEEKNEVMRLMVQSYNEPHIFLARPNFNRGNDIVRTL